MQDKQLPQAIECEEAIIDTLMAYPDSINNAIGILTPEMFYKSDLQLIYKICCEAIQQFGKVDIITVNDELKKKGVTDKIAYLTELSGRIFSSAMIDNHAYLVKEKYLLRKYIQAGNELVRMAYMEDLKDVAEKAEMDLLTISGILHNKEPQKLEKLSDNAINVVRKLVNKEIKLSGVPSGFTSFDRITGGFMNGDLNIIAGRPGQGKTALGLQIAKNAAELGYPVGIFSLEMPGRQQAKRFLSGVSGYSNVELTMGKCDIDQLL